MISRENQSDHVKGEDKTSLFLLNSVFVLSLFPFFKIIPFIEAEVQPFGGTLAIVYIFLNRNNLSKELTSNVIPYLLLLIGYFCVSIVLCSQGDIQPGHLVESFIIFIIPLACFVAISGNLKSKISIKAFKYSVFAWFAISFLQLLLPSLLSASGISFLLSILISRFSSEVLSDAGGRGVVGFSSEPAYAAQIIVFMLIYSIYLYTSASIRKKEFYLLLLQIIFMIFANRSGSIFLMCIVFFLPYIAFQSLKGIKFLFNSLIIIAFCVVIYNYSLTIFPALREMRMFQVFSDILGSVSGGEVDLVEIENSQGSLRNVGIQTGYLNAIRTFGLGSGIGGWGSHFLTAMEDVGFKISEISYFKSDSSLILNKKPFAYGALLAFDTGLIGLLGLIKIILNMIRHKIKSVKIKEKKKLTSLAVACLVYALFGLFYNSPASLPVAWITFLIFMES
jgi:hypothetical protein